MDARCFTVGPFMENSYLVRRDGSDRALFVDPGDEAPKLLNAIDALGVTLEAILLTHTHIDHVGAIFDLQQRAGTPASIHHADLFLFEKIDVQAQWLGVEAPPRGSIDHFLKDGQAVACSGVEIGVIHTPGHTPGSTTFVLPGDRNILFAGDTLFRQGIGRTDLWGGSYAEIIPSIEKKLMTFDDDTLVIAGHGPSTTIGHERRHNPFLR